MNQDEKDRHRSREPTPENEDQIRPGAAGRGCWVRVWEHENFGGTTLLIWGPVEYPNLRGRPGAGQKDWGDEIGSLQIGPNCWLAVYEDEHYQDTCFWFGPGSMVASLGGMGDNIDSLRLYDHPPARFLYVVTGRPICIGSE